MDIDLQIATKSATLPSLQDFERWAAAALFDQEHEYEICIRLVGKKESQQFNLQYRQKNKPTNVLSFSYGEEGLPLLGDLVICAPIVAEEAKEQNKDVRAHWAHLTVHGILHLLGYDHENEDQALEMENKEIAILHGLGIANPYNDR